MHCAIRSRSGRCATPNETVMPGLVPGIHVLALTEGRRGWPGLRHAEAMHARTFALLWPPRRDKPGHDGGTLSAAKPTRVCRNSASGANQNDFRTGWAQTYPWISDEGLDRFALQRRACCRVVAHKRGRDQDSRRRPWIRVRLHRHASLRPRRPEIL